MAKIKTTSNFATIVLLTALCSGIQVKSSIARELQWKTMADFDDVVQSTDCDIERDEGCNDFVSYVHNSKYGVQMYLTFFEGTHASVGFGTVENQAWNGSIRGMSSGAFEFGGQIRARMFVPNYVVKRFNDIDVDANGNEVVSGITHLIVFRLLSDGTSCMIDNGMKRTARIEVARKWAEIDFEDPKCAN